MLAARHARAPAKASSSSSKRAVPTPAAPHAPRRRPDARAAAAFSLAQIPPEALAAGAVVVAGALAAVAVAVKSNDAMNATSGAPATATAGPTAAAPLPPPPRENAVLVLGSTGRLGRRIVERLLASGRVVVAAARSEARAADVLLAPKDKGGLALSAQTRLPSGGALFVEPNVDVTDPSTLPPRLFEGVSQVVIALGGVVGRLPSGGFGYVDDMSPERVEAGGVPNVLAAIEAAGGLQGGAEGAGSSSSSSAAVVLPMATEQDLAKWDRLDDVIMGGQSSSAIVPLGDGRTAAWRGRLVHEGGGFCGQRTQKLGPADWSRFDGVEVRARLGKLGGAELLLGKEGSSAAPPQLPNNVATFKLNIKTLDQEDVPEATYQASFDVDAQGGWTTARIPWSDFVRVERAQAVVSPDDDGAAPLDPSQISKVGLVYSRFAFNKARNPNHSPGEFELQIGQGGLQAYKAVRPAVVAIGSAGVERNAIVGDDAERRAKEIPIVRLNPGGVLNHKHSAETAVRESGLAYSVIRCTGLVEEEAFRPPGVVGAEAAAEGGAAAAPPAAPLLPLADSAVPFLEADQGDTLVGRLTRDDAAAAVVAALATPDAVSKTFELRRADPRPTLRGQPRAMASERDWRRLFSRLARDEERVRAGLDPIPRPVPPPPPPTEEAKKEVLADPVVQQAAARDRAVRGAEVDRRERAEAKQEEGEGEGGEKAAAVEAEKEKEPVAAR
jgi:uncharacterized protein YbjT (DUF2867 family)